MHRILILTGLVLTMSGCARPCDTSRDCETGELCVLTDKTCIQGCESDDDCTHTCDVATGRCRLPPALPLPDSGTRTPTVAVDASVATDAATGTADAAIPDSGEPSDASN